MQRGALGAASPGLPRASARQVVATLRPCVYAATPAATAFTSASGDEGGGAGRRPPHRPEATIWKACSRAQRILLLGEGDFTHAATVASYLSAWGSKAGGGVPERATLVATSLDDRQVALRTYPRMQAALDALNRLPRSQVHFGVDATRIRETLPNCDDATRFDLM